MKQEITVVHKQLGKYVTQCEVQEIECLSALTESLLNQPLC